MVVVRHPDPYCRFSLATGLRSGIEQERGVRDGLGSLKSLLASNRRRKALGLPGRSQCRGKDQGDYHQGNIRSAEIHG